MGTRFDFFNRWFGHPVSQWNKSFCRCRFCENTFRNFAMAAFNYSNSDVADGKCDPFFLGTTWWTRMVKKTRTPSSFTTKKTCEAWKFFRAPAWHTNYFFGIIGKYYQAFRGITRRLQQHASSKIFPYQLSGNYGLVNGDCRVRVFFWRSNLDNRQRRLEDFASVDYCLFGGAVLLEFFEGYFLQKAKGWIFQVLENEKNSCNW